MNKNLGRHASGWNGEWRNKISQFAVALEGEGLSGHHEGFATWLAIGAVLGGFAVSVNVRALVAHLLVTRAFRRSFCINNW